MQYLWRVLIAAFACVLLFNLLPPLFSVFGFAVSGALEQVIRICAGGIAVFYVILGPPVAFRS